MAARSVTIRVDNNFDVDLVFDHDSLQHGIWGSSPPGRIAAGTSAQWVAESDGVATGTEGTVWYRLDIAGSTGLVRMHWDNPFVGSNNYDQSSPEVLTVQRVGDGSGNDSTAHWVIADASTTGDGIPDSWKLTGATIDPGDGSGPQFVDLPAMGATVGKPDVFVHLDWMSDPSHTHRPAPAAIQQVVDAFANAPYIARNGAIGINLHVDAGPDSVLNPANGATWGPLSRAASVGHAAQLGTTNLDGAGNLNYDWTDFDKLKNRAGGHVRSGRAPIFRYAVACHQIGSVGNSGVARNMPGSDFIISLGTFTGITDLNTAGTFMHELGHALGLDHGGSDGVNNKPNYLSVMNYLWQFSGILRNGVAVLDYSSLALAVLNELSLDETVGLGPGSAGYGTRHWVPPVAPNPGAFVAVADASQPIDWNGDGLTSTPKVAVDANNDPTQGPLNPCNDWQILKLRGGAIGSGGYQPATTSVIPPELTPADQALILPPDTTPPTTSATLSPTPNAAGWNRTPVRVTLAAVDDISGVARTEYVLDGLGPTTYVAPVVVSSEGVHDLGYRSIDRSQNIEALHHVPVRVDLTAPEVVISYDPMIDDVVVEGRDGLSGVLAGPVPPTSRIDVAWTSFGSDVAEVRLYEVQDRAGNTTTLYLKVRCSPFAYEASVLALVYDDVRHRDDRDLAVEREQAAALAIDPAALQRPGLRSRAERNTMVFERLVGRNGTRPLLGVRQLVAIGEGEARRTVKARWDGLDDYTILIREVGSGSCGPCRQRADDDKDPRPEDQDPRPDDQDPRPDDQGADPGCGCGGTGNADGVTRDGCTDTQPTHDGGDHNKPTGPCLPAPLAETDLRGLLLLHVLSQEGSLHVME